MPDGLFAERSGPGDVFLRKRLRNALLRINRDLPAAAVEEALRKLSSIDAVLAIDRNHQPVEVPCGTGLDAVLRHPAEGSGHGAAVPGFRLKAGTTRFAKNRFSR